MELTISMSVADLGNTLSNVPSLRNLIIVGESGSEIYMEIIRIGILWLYGFSISLIIFEKIKPFGSSCFKSEMIRSIFILFARQFLIWDKAISGF
jgi:hypothetical protein